MRKVVGGRLGSKIGEVGGQSHGELGKVVVGGSEDGKGGERWEGGGGEELARWERWEGKERGCSAELARWERSKASELVSRERWGEGVVRSSGSGKGARVVTWKVGKGGGMGARR